TPQHQQLKYLNYGATIVDEIIAYESVNNVFKRFRNAKYDKNQDKNTQILNSTLNFLSDKGSADNWKHSVHIKGSVLKRIVWVSSSMMSSITESPDICIIDGTYKTNHFNMPLLVLSVVDNEGHRRVAAAALVSDEREETFAWLFNFLNETVGWKPKNNKGKERNARRLKCARSSKAVTTLKEDDRRREKYSAKIDCPFRIRIKLNDKGQCFIHIAELAHNHGPDDLCLQKKKTYDKLAANKDNLKLWIETKTPQHQQLKYLNYGATIVDEMITYESVNNVSRRFRNAKYDENQDKNTQILNSTLNFLSDKGSADNWKHSVHIKGSVLKRIVWVSSSMMSSITESPDICIIDGTYKTNHFNMPLLVLSVVDNEGHRRVAAAALVSDEREETFAWLFNFLNETVGWKPKRQGEFAHSEFNVDIVSNYFETRFPKKCRIQNWAVSQASLTFTLDIKSTQRAESINSKIKKCLNSSSTIEDYIKEIEQISFKIELDNLKDNSRRDSVINKSCIQYLYGYYPRSLVDSALSNVSSKGIHWLYKAMKSPNDFKLEQVNVHEEFEYSFYLKPKREKLLAGTVSFTNDGLFMCTWGYYIRSGIICQHMFALHVQKSVPLSIIALIKPFWFKRGRELHINYATVEANRRYSLSALGVGFTYDRNVNEDCVKLASKIIEIPYSNAPAVSQKQRESFRA
ncbi:hypothetical protein MP638_002652, partial [Amoeboaphelidium occidentale]